MAELVIGQNGMGGNGYGRKMVMGQNDPEPVIHLHDQHSDRIA